MLQVQKKINSLISKYEYDVVFIPTFLKVILTIKSMVTYNKIFQNLLETARAKVIQTK